MAKTSIQSGDSLIYSTLRDLLDDPDADYGDLPVRLIVGTSVWFPRSLYENLPTLLPWVVRDPSCRKGEDGQDEWGAPNENAYQRDDNSAIKGLPRSMIINGPKGSALNGKKLGKEFVASHIWRKTSSNALMANRVPELNSFVPNLVWLPRQIAKLSDREGSPIQLALQSISYQIYNASRNSHKAKSWVSAVWSELQEPKFELHGLNIKSLHYFKVPDSFVPFRISRIKQVITALDLIENKQDISELPLTSRYKNGLPRTTAQVRKNLKKVLEDYLTSLEP